MAGDEITITDAESTSVVYVAETSGASVSFKKKEGETGSLAAGSTYSATYKAAPATVQAYADYYSAVNQAKDLYMTASPTSGTTLSFTAACGLLKLNLTASGDNAKDISRIEIVGTPTGGSAAVYTLSCNNESIESAKDFYIALPAGDYTLMKFINSKGCVCFKKATTAMAIEANKIQPVTLSGITFSAVLPGKFTVASGKQVQFTTANLWCNASASPVTYSLESAQNVTYKTLGQTKYTADHVCHFHWSKDASVAYAQTYSDAGASTDDKFFCGEDNPVTIDGQSGLYALTGGSSGEWYYLFKTRNNASSLYKKGVSVTTSAGTVASCLVIAPDDYSGTIADSYDAAAWATAESNGLVCLPAAGYRKDSNVYQSSRGHYWSATPDGSSPSKAYYLFFTSFDFSLSESLDRNKASSVRLVYGEAPAIAGTAKATINSQEVDVAWVQLWKDGSKFAKCNYGATSQDETNIGTAVNYSTACTSLWGSNWKTPTKDEMDLLNTTKVSCTYCQESGVWGFKFTGVQAGYTDNSLFLPSDWGESDLGYAKYWSSTADGNKACALSLDRSYGAYDNAWCVDVQSLSRYVRPVLSN